MSSLTFPFLWCAVQVTVLSTVALTFAIATTKRHPEVAARLLVVAVLVTLFMTVLIPVSIPFHFIAIAITRTMPQANHVQTEQSLRIATSTTVADGLRADELNSGFQFNLETLINRLKELKQTKSIASGDMSGHFAIGLGILGLGVAFGAGKLLLGLFLLRMLRCRSRLIADADFLAMVKRMAKDMGITQQISFAESDEIPCAAVVGFIRPNIIFSSEWKQWLPEVQRAVLAHELAHVRRRDAFWRLIATVCRIIHFYNPLMRMLTARLVLAQELAADRIALANAGGSKTYLRSLSRLALLEDARPYVRSQSTVTPVFSGHLMRRVEMLRAMDCKQSHSSRSWLSCAAMMSITIFAITTTVLRGFAEADNEENAAISAAGNGIIIPVAVSDKLERPSFFQREKVAATHPAFGKSGGMFLNCAALRQTALWPILEGIFKSSSSESVTSQWNLNGLDSIASDVILTVQERKGEQSGRIMFGTSAQRIKTSIDVDWRTAIHTLYPDTVDSVTDGVEFFHVMIPAMGPFPSRLHGVGPRELAVFTTTTPLDDRNHTKCLNPDEVDCIHTWNKEWDAVSGGVFAVVITRKTSNEPLSDKMEPGSEQANLLNQSIESVSVGIDICNNAVETRFRLGCSQAADPAQVLKSVQQLISIAKNEPNDTENTSLDVTNALMYEAFENADVQIIRGEQNIIEFEMKGIVAPEFLKGLWGVDNNQNEVSTRKQAAEKPESSTTKQ